MCRCPCTRARHVACSLGSGGKGDRPPHVVLPCWCSASLLRYCCFLATPPPRKQTNTQGANFIPFPPVPTASTLGGGQLGNIFDNGAAAAAATVPSLAPAAAVLAAGLAPPPHPGMLGTAVAGSLANSLRQQQGGVPNGAGAVSAAAAAAAADQSGAPLLQPHVKLRPRHESMDGNSTPKEQARMLFGYQRKPAAKASGGGGGWLGGLSSCCGGGRKDLARRRPYPNP